MTDTHTLKKFLLDDLAADRREAVEDLMFADDEIFQRLCVLDDDLVEAYTRGELSASDSQRLFRRLNASDRGKRTLDFMVQVAERAKARAREEQAPQQQTMVASEKLRNDENPTSRSFFNELKQLFQNLTLAPRAAWVMCSLLAMAIALPMIQMERMSFQLESLDAQRAALTSQIESMELKSKTPGLAPVQTTFSLRPLVRAQEDELNTKLVLAPRTESLELWLDPGGLVTYPDFRVSLRAHREDIWRSSALESHENQRGSLIVSVEIPTEIITPGKYDVILDGRAEDRYHEVARYPIDVEIQD